MLTEAATLGRIDHLRGFKENVIMGHLIPAGTGFERVRNARVLETVDPLDYQGEEELEIEEGAEAKDVGEGA